MNKEETQLLLKDLCARIPYGVKVQFKLPDYENKVFTEEIGEVQSISKYGEVSVNSKGIDYRFIQLDCKPYLRPMSSMTDKEKKRHKFLIDEQRLYGTNGEKLIDWYNENHFDYRGLIDKSLALEAFEGMYN